MYMMGLTYMATLIVGTLTMRLGTKLCCKPQGYEDVDNNDARAQDNERKSTMVVVSAFIVTFLSCTACVLGSLKTERLSKNNVLDWELYWMLFSMNCLWQIAQAAYKVGTAHGRVYSWTAFAEATIGGTLPFLSDSFDTLRDVIFAGLCFQSNKPMLKWIGVASWMYLVGIHMLLLLTEAHVMELQTNYTSVLIAPSENGRGETADDRFVLEEHRKKYRCYDRLVKLLVILVKQTTPSKQLILVLENAVQAIGAVVYARLEGGSPFVVALNLVVPVAQVVFARLSHRSLKQFANPALASLLKQAYTDNNAVAKHIYLKMVWKPRFWT